MKLYTFWLPFVGFDKFLKTKKRENERELSSSIRMYREERSGYRVIFDSTGFFYIETSNKFSAIVEDIINEFVTNETKQLLFATFFNSEIKCDDADSLSAFNEVSKKEQNEILKNFLLEIYEVFDFDILKSVELNFLSYSLDEERRTKYKLETSQESIKNIINRNLEHLINKSHFYTKGFTFEENEIYNLEILKELPYEQMIRRCELKLCKNQKEQSLEKKREFLRDILKKAVQDSIEEYTLLQFLKVTKNDYITKIYQKITEANESINKLHSQILAVDYIQEDDKNSCKIKSEEELELFLEHLLQAITRFKVIDNKIKSAYYLKIGNVSTESSVAENETIEHMYFYIQWSNALKYFENMAQQLKEILILYHQNKNIKELEDITYYENYKSDLEDIKDLKFKEKKERLFSSEDKNYIDGIVLIITLAALAGEAPIIDPAHISGIYPPVSNGSTSLISFFSCNTLTASAKLLFITLLNLLLYFGVLWGGILFLRKIGLRDFTRLIPKLSSKNATKDENIYFFDDADYDKHEHRSSKPLLIYNENSQKEEKDEPLYISYREYFSAYHLILELKKQKLIKRGREKNYTFDLFPKILKEVYSQRGYGIRENYRISRKDKVTTKILFRYKITDLHLEKFLDFIKDDNFREYYEAIYNECFSKKNQDGMKEKETIAYHLELLDNLKGKGVKLNLYIVYSFTLKMKSHNVAQYSYKVIKDQFRVHYHINQLPKDRLELYQHSIAELIYIYFLARLKRFNYIFKSKESSENEVAKEGSLGENKEEV